MNSTAKTILAAIDEAFSPEREAARRKKNAARKQAEYEKLLATPSPNHAAYLAIASHLKFEIDPALVKLINAYKLEWSEAFKVASEHTHDKVRKAYHDHELEIQEAASRPDDLRNLSIRNFEDFQTEFMTKLKSANRKCAEIAGKINALVKPVCNEFADAIERLEWQVDEADRALADSLGLELSPSHTVMQLRKAVLDIRNGVPRISPSSKDETFSIADFICRK